MKCIDGFDHLESLKCIFIEMHSNEKLKENNILQIMLKYYAKDFADKQGKLKMADA